MSGDSSDGDPFDMELATAGILADTSDVKLLLQLLARQLAGALGERVQVERGGGRFRRRKADEVRSVRVLFRGQDYTAELTPAGLVCTVGHDSAGIRIRSERVPTEEWLTRLLRELQAEADHNQASKMALEHLLMGGPS